MTEPSALTGANAHRAMRDRSTRDAWTYWIDACQRWVLFWDVLRQRSERYQEHAAKGRATCAQVRL